MENTLTICPKCDGSGRIEPDESGYDGCDLCNYGEGPTGFVPDYAEEAADDAASTLEDRLGDDYSVSWSRDDDGEVRLHVRVA